MLRYFYILFCIQLCFCTEYIDNADNDSLDRRARSKTTKLNKKLSTKKSRMVPFDVLNFMQKAEEDGVVDDNLEAFQNKKPENRRSSLIYGDYGYLVESNDRNAQSNKQVDYFNIKGNDEESNKRSSATKEANARRFNFHTMSFEDKDDGKTKDNHEKARSNIALSPENPEKKCGFKNMKIPFFSHDTTKPRWLKKRKMFCFNCHRTSTAAANDNPYEAKNFDFNREKTRFEGKYINKRSYDYLCPKCIKELLNNFRRKTTKKQKSVTTKLYHKDSKATVKEKTTMLPKDTLEDKLRYDDYSVDYVRSKREIEEERSRRLKELEEVEKRIDGVHITVPSFKMPMDLNNQ